jgi:ABC-type antimicrobial peptide transport system permease subunit
LNGILFDLRAVARGWQRSPGTALAAVNPLALAVSAGVLRAAVFAACWLPARRAAAVDPMRALEED